MKESEYTISIVTYHARFEEYFKPLINKITEIFPDKEIICIANGHPDKTLQINYLKRFVDFCKTKKNIKYLTYDEHQSLAKCWNQLIILSNTEKILIMNDDTQISDLFREEFEKKVISLNFSTINKSWSHFLITKEIIKKVGWFDERFLGVGQEDGDYVFRMLMNKIPVKNSSCLGLKNYVADMENPGWKKISKKISSNKYSEYNLDFFNKKWETPDNIKNNSKEKYQYTIENENYTYLFSPKIKDISLEYYDYRCLDKNNNKKIDLENQIIRRKKIKIIKQKIYYLIVAIVKKIYRFLIK